MQPLSSKPRQKHLERLLDAGSSLAFKIWKLSRPLIALKWALVLAALSGVVWLFYDRWDESILGLIPEKAVSWLTFKNIAIVFLATLFLTVLAAGVNALAGKKILHLSRWRDTLKNIAAGIGMSFAGFLAARLHLHVFDRLFLRSGKLDKFPPG
jgi:hypothetical protein